MYTRFFTGLPLQDHTSGFKSLRKSVLEKIPNWGINTGGYGIQIETNFFASRIESALRVLQLGISRLWNN